ncbi:MAG: Glycosyl transferase family 2 [Candidatus Collierbacteria bacterium GW2011_GWB1_44_6]|uniref:Glycosyl transferase family 2 n=2 Tax=Candidatus Collieribacteriota TaxID=1752725 RepID=A0A0G1JNG3_9BACT|nr:MAG: Glycosyl transferase family 2 [Candidatus Collierbacteria bacterium GW2011_GWC2_43_12]KKT73071.1 MAG: Glycosyl transferase family 2 [Candidatus Collierbacteria bacterium GW2011_GWB1_44_6]KKT83206.1 MAG: Glycosyl transferase family 2 [Microgenomates group bacterium GW2011_GWC1_44_9]
MKEQFLQNYLESSANILSENDRLPRLSEDINISIVVPAYNEESYIGTLLECLNDQIFDHKFELIIVDNGSTDQTAEVVGSFSFNSENRVCVVNERNIGAGRARKTGVDEIIRRVLDRGGEIPKRHFIVLTDADTQPGKTWLSKMYEQMSKSSQSILVSGNYHASPETDEIVEKEIGIKNYFLSFSRVSELLDLSIGQIRMRGPNSGFEIECYAKAGGFRQPLDVRGNTAPRECFDLVQRVNEIGAPVEHFEYSIITSQRRKLFELINEISTYDMVEDNTGRFLSNRDDENMLLNYALKNVPDDRWIEYQESILCRIVINSLLNPLLSMSTKNIQNRVNLDFWTELMRDVSVLDARSLSEKWASVIARELLLRISQ